MRFGTAVFSAFLCLAIAPVFSQLPEELNRKFTEAERRIVRLSPASFPQLPANLVSDLQRRGCTIPQEAFTKHPHNVIKGQFARPGQTDWAVLCSRKGASSILVFWHGSEMNPAEIAQREDRIFLQEISADEIGFSRGISAVGKEFIIRHSRAYGGPLPPPVDHQGSMTHLSKKRPGRGTFTGGNGCN